MKYIAVIPDGMADKPIEELGDKTPLEVSHTANMDYLARNGTQGLLHSIPKGMPPGSEIGNLSLLGYRPDGSKLAVRRGFSPVAIGGGARMVGWLAVGGLVRCRWHGGRIP